MRKPSPAALAALALAAHALLCIIIGLATPLKAGTGFGIRVNWLDLIFQPNCYGNSSCDSMNSQLITCFFFCLMGMVANLALITSLVSANGFVALPAPLGTKKPTAGVGLVVSLFYLIGMVCGQTAYNSYVGGGGVPEIGAGGVFMIIGFIFAVAATGVTLAIDDGSHWSVLEDVPTAGAATPGAAAEKIDLEAPAAKEEEEAPTEEEAPAAEEEAPKEEGAPATA